MLAADDRRVVVSGTDQTFRGEPAHVDDPTVMVGADESYEARRRSRHTLRTE